MLRILHLVPHIQEAGNGITNVVVDLACLQAKDGYEVTVASKGGEYEALLTSYGAKHLKFDQTLNPITLLKSIARYKNILLECQPHIVHVHTPRAVVLAKIFKDSSKYALVATMHSSNYKRNAILMGWAADRVIAVANAVACKLEQAGVPDEKLRVVLNGTLGSPRTRALKDYQPKVLQHPAIITVAGMHKRKGITELINAFEFIASEFPEAHLYLVGDGPERSKLMAKVQSTSIADRVHFEGFQPEPQRYMLATDIFVLASHTEPFGLAIAEAREAGCAVIGSNVDGIPEVLEAGKAGLLVMSQNSQALAQALAKLLGNQNELNYWKNQAKLNLERLSLRRACQETLVVYHELISK